jgi:hypothetical protein
MTPLEPDHTPAPEPTPAREPTARAPTAPPGPGPAAAPAPAPAPRRPPWGLGLAAGLLAGVASWAAGEVGRVYVNPTPLSREVFPEAGTARLLASASVASGMLTYGLQGAILGLMLGLAGGLARRSPAAAVGAVVLGVGAAGSAGALAARVLIPVFFRNVDDQAADLTLPLLVHGGLWCPIGAAAGLALGFGRGGWVCGARAALGGLLGAVVGTMVYEAGGALLFPLAKTVLPIPLSVGARGLAHLAVAAPVALCAAVASQAPNPRPGPAPGGV